MTNPFDRAWARIDTVKADDIVEVNGFTCLDNGSLRRVQQSQGGLYICCRDGHHYLDGQKDTSGEFYVGVFPIKLIA